ncbi:MAG: hypothetical protein ACRD9L_16270, partial [Bryobacteraceae bacterium]
MLQLHFVRTIGVGVLASALLLGAGSSALQLTTPRPGDATISGSAAAGSMVMITRKHKNGVIDEKTVKASQRGQFSVTWNSHDTVAAGDQVSAKTVTPDGWLALPEVIKVTANPTRIQFANEDAEGTLPAADSTIQVDIEDSSGAEWSKPITGKKTATVIAPDTIQIDAAVDMSAVAGANLSSLQVKVAPPGGSTNVTITDPLCEWGRVRCYAYFGAIFSQKNAEFSQTDPYLDFTVEWNWLKHDRWAVTTFFDSRLTQIPAPDSPTVGDKNSTPPKTQAAADSGAATPSPSDAFASSKKSAQAQAAFTGRPTYPNSLSGRSARRTTGSFPPSSTKEA